MSAMGPGSDNQAVNHDIQQILTEVRPVKRYVDTLNTPVSGDSRGDANDERRLVIQEWAGGRHESRHVGTGRLPHRAGGRGW